MFLLSDLISLKVMLFYEKFKSFIYDFVCVQHGYADYSGNTLIFCTLMFSWWLDL